MIKEFHVSRDEFWFVLTKPSAYMVRTNMEHLGNKCKLGDVVYISKEALSDDFIKGKIDGIYKNLFTPKLDINLLLGAAIFVMILFIIGYTLSL